MIDITPKYKIIPISMSVFLEDDGLGTRIGGVGGLGGKPATEVNDAAIKAENAINDDYDVITDLINARLDTSSKKILSDFNFGSTDYAGAVKAGDITWNTTTGAITGGSGVAVYRGGIVGAKAGVATFSLDAGTGDATFAGTLVAAVGTLGSVTAGTFTGCLFRTAASGQRIILSSSSNTLKIYDEDGTEVVDMGTFGANPILEISLTARTHNGITINGAPDDTSYGFEFLSAEDRASVALNIEMTSANALNNLSAISVKNYGSGELFYGEVHGTGKGLSILRSSDSNGTDNLFRLQSDNNTANTTTVKIIQNGVDVTTPCVDINSATKGIALDVRVSNVDSSNPAGYFGHNSTTGSALQLNKSVSGECLVIGLASNDTHECSGIRMNISNAGTGVEHAFDFQGSEVNMAATSVATVTGVIKIKTTEGTRYIPIYQTAS